MPIYEYKCVTCNSVTEVQRNFGEDREPVCCESSMQRVWTSPGVIFNGSGFYSTDK